MLNAAQRDKIVSILGAANDLTIATLRADGWPQATTVSYASDGLTIYFGAGAAAQKARNIARDNRVSVAITNPYRTWDEIKGVSIGGRAARVTAPDELAKAGALMLKKFPQIGQFAEFGSGMEMALFRIEPLVISILDYSKGFGNTELIEM
jgi:nitroimidazol reductase NimA-like FMN-containing flavoprotein (pyridoxamine 5'-phosphate oxidase superfamily)